MVLVEDRDTTLILRGKALVLEGNAYVFGCRVKMVENNSFFPLYLEEGKVLVEGEFIPVKGSTIPESWINLSKKLDDFSKIFLVGKTDSGKSSLATWLVNSIEGEVCVIDADVGQSDIAHPGAMGFGIADKVPFMRDISMLDGFFAGTISPSGKESKCLRGFFSICRKSEKHSQFRIVDTTGWVSGKKARDYKLAKIDIFSPDLVVFVGEYDWCLYEENVDCEVVKVESFVPKRRDRESRMRIRSSIYKAWFDNAVEFEVGYRRVKTSLFRGKEIYEDFLSIFGDVVFAEVGKDFLNVCVEKAEISAEGLKAVKEVFGVEEVNVFEEEWFNSLICGIYSNNRYICPGKVVSVDFSNKKFIIEARECPENVTVELGDFRIVNGKEEFVRIP